MLKSAYKKISPYLPAFIKDVMYFLRCCLYRKQYSVAVAQVLAKYSSSNIADEEKAVVAYLEHCWCPSVNQFVMYSYLPIMFPYPWIYEYANREIVIGKDKQGGCYYCEDNGKKLYSRPGTSMNEMRRFVTRCLEMDIRSPHRYVTGENELFGTIPNVEATECESSFFVEKGDVVADVGSAEGNFALSVIDVASHIYLFECDPLWIKALELTFKDYLHKVTIVNKCVSDCDTEKSITLDTFFEDKQINFIKADVEGAEMRMLTGSKSLLKRNDVKWSVCTYHKQKDAQDFKEFYEQRGYQTEFTRGLMQNGGSLRKAIIRARKERVN